MERLYQSLIKRPQFGYKTTLLFLGGKRVYQWSLNRLVPESSGFPSADAVGNEDEKNSSGAHPNRGLEFEIVHGEGS